MALEAFVECLAVKREHGKAQHDYVDERVLAHKHTHTTGAHLAFWKVR